MDFTDALKWLEGVFVWLWGQWQVKFLVGHIVVNVVVAIATTVRTGEFVLGKVPEFLFKKVLPLTAVYAVFALFGEAIEMEGVAFLVWVLLETMLASDTLDNLKRLGISRIPEALTKERLS